MIVQFVQEKWLAEEEAEADGDNIDEDEVDSEESNGWQEMVEEAAGEV